MERLNYHHLLYFWAVAGEGSIAAACERLCLTQPTISTQLHTLERALGHKLFTRVGRKLTLTETGRVVFRYADDIFSLGRELMDVLEGRPTGSPLRFQVGVADVLPKLVVHRLLAPAFAMAEPIRLACFEGKAPDLLARLSIHELDAVLLDGPIPPHVGVRAFSHLLGECGVSIFGDRELTARHRRRFPQSLDGAPFLLPTVNATLRRALDQWFDARGIRPLVVGEFEDTALLKVFGQLGVGLLGAPSVIEQDMRRQLGLRVVGRLDSVRAQFYAISMERKVKHPAVVAITAAAHSGLFSNEG